MDDALIGRQIRGYEITTLLGRGGYGAVYKAHQPLVGRDVAIKVILPQHAQNAEFTRRFEVEAQLVAQLEHPYIVPLYDYWQDENGAFLVMRMVRGGSLRDQLKENGPLPLKQVMRLYDHVGAALSIAHEAGIIHRDIKPDNILIDQYSNAYLTDFGIAKAAGLNLQITTNDEDIIGTPAYLSPEQIRSMPVSAQSDIYSLGIMLYEVLTGTIPFDKPGMQVIMQHLQEPVPSLLNFNPDLPEALDDVIARATAKEGVDRFETVTELVEALRDVIAPAVTPLLPVDVQPRIIKPNQHVFISYSRHDNEFIQRLIYDLESEGIPVWVDKKGLKPGTRNWEDSLRNATRNAYAILYIASPESRRSPYVLDELAIADMYNCPVYPVWAAGEEWMDSIPMGMGKIQFIDARGDAYGRALMELVMILGSGQDDQELLKETDPNLRISDSFVPRNPYKGLRAFRQDDQTDFFGRNALIAELVETIQTQMQPNTSRLLAVIGPSGSGKSSVVMAGLLPALQKGGVPESERWTYLPPMVPGTAPIENLAIALGNKLSNKSHAVVLQDLREPSARGLHILARQMVERQSSRLVLYVDQFEELFTQTMDEAERQQFINLLVSAVTEPGGPVTVILTLRADFYDRPMNYPELGKLIETNSKSVLPMSLSDLYDVIQKPAQLPDVMLKFDSGLVAELVFEVRDQLGGLPLLQFTLDQLFERRMGRRLTMTAYEEIGGVRGALAKHTEATYNELPSEDHRRLARGLFLRLIEPGATEQDTTRRRAPRSELTLDDPQQNRMMDMVINAFVNARLLLMDQHEGLTTVEVSHEALIREWNRLAEWLYEARNDIALQRGISADCEAWIARGKRELDDGLYRGTLLEEAQLWAKRNLPSQDEAEFIRLSAKAQQERKEREERTARRVKYSTIASIALGVMSVIAVIALLSSITQVSTANESLQTATVAQGIAFQQIEVVGATLTPAGLLVIQANTEVADAGTQAAFAQVQVVEAETQVAGANATQTPAAQTLAAAEVQIVAASTEVFSAQTLAATAATQAANAEQAVVTANAQALLAQALVEEAGQTLTPVAPTLTAVAESLLEANVEVGAAQTLAAGAQVEAANAGTQVAQSNATQTPVALTLVAGQSLLATAEVQVEAAQTLAADAQLNAADAGTQVAQSNETQTPVALTLVAGEELLATAEVQVEAAQTLAAGAQVEAANAGTQVAQSNETQTPVALTLVAGEVLVASANTQVAQVGETLTPISGTVVAASTDVFAARIEVTNAAQTLTPVGATLVAANERLAGVEPTVAAANTQIIAASTDVFAARVAVTNAAETLAPVGATLEAANERLAGVEPTLTQAQVQIDGVVPTVAAANTQVAGAGQTLTPLAVTLVAANEQAEESQRLALSQSLAVNAEQAINNEEYDLALVLALESIQANPNLVQSQRLLNNLVFSSARFSFDDAPLTMMTRDGTGVAVVEGNEVILWDNATRTERLRFTGHTGAINAIDFNEDGTAFLTASEDGTVIVWDVGTGQPRSTLTGHTGAVNDAEFSRDGASIISGGADNVNILWNANDGTERRRFTNGTGREIIRVLVNGNSSRFWSWERAGEEIILLFWATDRANPLWTSQVKVFGEFERENLQYAFRENDSSLEVTIWDTGSPNETALRTLNLTTPANQFGIPTAKAFNTNGATVFLAFANQGQGNTQIVEWNYNNNAVTPLFTLQGVQRVEAIGFDSSGALVAFGFGKQIILYDRVNLRELRRLSAHSDIVSAIEFSPDGRYLLSRSKDHNTRLWDISGGDPAEISRIVARTQNSNVTYPGLSPDGALAFSVQKSSMFGWEARTGQQTTRDDSGDILNAVYSPDNPYALAVFANVAVVYDMSVSGTPPVVARLGGENEVNNGAAAWVPGRTAVVTDGNLLALRDWTQRGVQVQFSKDLIPDDSKLVSLVVSPDNRYLVGVSAIDYAPNQTPDPDERAQNIIMWDMITGEVVRTFGADQHNRRINSVAVSPDSTRVLSASSDGTLIVWDIESGRLLTRLSGHRGGVNVGVFTGDGRFAISASEDTSLIQWELQTGQPLRRFNGHTAPVRFLMMSANGVNFITSTGDDTMVVWELTDISATIVYAIQNRFVRTLTCDEGRQFGLTTNCDEGETVILNDDSDEPSLFDITAVPTLEPCYVQAIGGGVAVWTGPDVTSTARSFLPANQEYVVNGQTLDSAGNTWWRLQWSNPAPREENRYWVAEAEVEERGGCFDVPEVQPE
jgi:serine/threonine protein kinase/WD40 repeat protein